MKPRTLHIAQLGLLVVLAAMLVGNACMGEPAIGLDGEGTRSLYGTGDVLVLNEGLFRRSNGSLARYDRESGQVSLDVAIRSTGMGFDVLQSALVLNDSLLLVVSNNTNELVVLSRPDLIEVATYPGLGSPRYAASASESEVLVTDLYGGGLLLLDWRSGARREIALDAHTEQMALAGAGILVTAPDRAYLYYFDPSTRQVTDSMRVGLGLSAIAAFPSGEPERYIAATGVLTAADSGRILSIDWPARVSSQLIALPVEESSLYPRVANGDEGTYILQRDLHVVRSAGDGLQLSTTETGLEQPYGLGVDPQSGDVYLGDANRLFSGAGRVLRLNVDLQPVDTFTVGALPGGFVF